MASSRRSPWLLPALVVLLVALPIAEVWILIQTGRAIGAWWTIAILVAEAIIGAWLWKREGVRTWRELRSSIQSGRMPGDELIDAALVLVGGVMLMLPGFLTDVVGFFFLLPVTRPLTRRLVNGYASRRIQRLGVDLDLVRARTDPGMTIDGEVVDAPVADRQPHKPGNEPPAISGTVI